MVKRGSLFTCKSPERISTRPSLETSEDLSSFYLLLNLRSSLINYDLDKTMRCPAMRKGELEKNKQNGYFEGNIESHFKNIEPIF